jgi:hypothetical protein
MNQICIAKKVAVNNVEFLDFAVDELDQLLVFPNFKSASEFLKAQVGTGEQLLDFIITTTEAQSNNTRMKELLARSVVNVGETEQSETLSTGLPDVPEGYEEVECTFLLHCSNFDIKNNEMFYDKVKNRTLAPCLVFVDVNDPSKIVQTENFTLKAAYSGKLQKQ